jgi:N-methylhydantoinase B/oxoprolinase/acetone carboxylase alpha subunit
LVVLSQRLNFPPVGRNGGENGSLERILLNGDEVEGGKPFRLNKGDVITLDLPGGGGFGAVAERLRDRHEADLKDGLV